VIRFDKKNKEAKTKNTKLYKVITTYYNLSITKAPLDSWGGGGGKKKKF